MKKQMRLLVILSGIIISLVFNSKAEPDTFVDKIETPAEILSRCEQDIDTMNPDDSDTVKHILNIVVQTINIGSKQLETSVNLFRAQPKPKKSILCSLKQLVSPNYEPIKGLTYEERETCREEASYKMSILCLSQKVQELLESLSKHDQAIVRNVRDYITGKIEYKNEVLRHLPTILSFRNYNY
jgi:peptidoglycan hydrolase CwlO-like protein